MKYIVLNIEEAHKRNYKSPWDEPLNELPNLGWGLFLVEDNEDFIRCICLDGGEPEDQTLARDWSWVETELNKALRGDVRK